MKRAHVVRGVTAALLTAAVAASAAREEPDWSKISFKVHKLAPNVYMLEGQGGFAGGNIGVLSSPDATLIVDASFPELSPKVQAAVKSVSPAPVKYIMNTHFHFDHTTGNMILGKGATVIAHERVRERLLTQGWKGATEPTPAAALPVITLSDTLAVHLGSEDVRARHYAAAHTDSDVVVTFAQANVVHMGDLFFNGVYPFIDLRGGGSVPGYVAAVEAALREVPPGAKVIPGHGPPATRKELEAYAAMLRDAVTIVEKGVLAEKSAAELKQAKILDKYDAAWGKGFLTTDAFIDELYRGLGGAKP